ncbi:MAG: DUF1778 domain-containing protein [Gammaproteobacteria bacterium]|nr:DUF1778 domain-containing protein [Gammaproteobacteria bacterium]
MRLSIEVTPEQHQRLKAAAALQGQSIKDYVLERSLPNHEEQKALQELETFLEPRIAAAKKRELSTRTIDSIFDEVEKDESGQ